MGVCATIVAYVFVHTSTCVHSRRERDRNNQRQVQKLKILHENEDSDTELGKKRHRVAHAYVWFFAVYYVTESIYYHFWNDFKLKNKKKQLQLLITVILIHVGKVPKVGKEVIVIEERAREIGNIGVFVVVVVVDRCFDGRNESTKLIANRWR